MDQQRIDAKKMFRELSFPKKVEHIWFYYRSIILGSLLALALVCYGIYEVLSKPDYDLEGTFYASAYITEDQVAKMEEYFSDLVEDRNGDGKKNVKLYLSCEATIGEVEGAKIVNTKFSSEMAAGLNSFIIVDDTYRELLKEDVFSNAIKTPQELTAVPDFQEKMDFRENLHVYWATRAIYSDEKDESEATKKHDTTVNLENRIFK